MQLRVIARLALKVRQSPDLEWDDAGTFDLNQSVVRVGRSKKCEIAICLPDKKEICRQLSRVHATLFYYPGELDYWIMDGAIGEPMPEDQSLPVSASSLGVYLNSKARKLEVGQKYILHDKDEIHLVYDKIKLIYIRDSKKISETLLEETYVPEEAYEV